MPALPALASQREAPIPWRSDLPRWRQLVSARWLHGLLMGDEVAAAPAAGWCVFEVGEGPWSPAQAPTIPGACWLDVQQFEGGPFWNRVPDDVLLQRLAAVGIRHDTPVVLAGRKLVANARMAHLMLCAGVDDVRLLDGGTSAWLQAGLPLWQDAPPIPQRWAGFGLGRPGRPQLMVDTADVRNGLQRPDLTLVSVRTWTEYLGQTSGYDYIPAMGEIPGARWGHAGMDGDVNDMGAFHTPEGLMSGAAHIAALWRDQGIDAQGHTVFYCGTGWRASLAFFYAWLMGWERISVYDGGWFEWSSNPSNPTVNHHQSRAASRAA